MGYTHYWEISGNITPLEWSNFIVDFEKVLPKFQHLLDDKGSQKLSITSEKVFFNGVYDDAHETFSIGIKNDGFYFCKTARKPYDVAVTTALIIAKHHFGNTIKVSSDGEDNDWNIAGTMCQERLGYGAEFSVERKMPRRTKHTLTLGAVHVEYVKAIAEKLYEGNYSMALRKIIADHSRLVNQKVAD